MDTATPKSIGQRLFFVRNQHKDSQFTTAEHLSVSSGSYKKYEADKVSIPIPAALKFSSHYQIHIAWLITGLHPIDPDIDGAVVREAVSEILLLTKNINPKVPDTKLAEACGFLAKLCLTTNQSPKDAAPSVVDLIS
jgi:transcriptional regulator with XRE-family HTH domain